MWTMKLWQASMIRLARFRRVTAFAQRPGRLAGLATRFVGGPDPAATLATVRRLRAEGITASLYYLGEYVDDPALVALTVQRLEEMVDELRAAEVDVHVSVDPTQLGLMDSEAACQANVGQVAAAVGRYRAGHDTLMLDMEDAGTTEVTLRLYDLLRSQGLPAAVTVQAYLHRAATDLDRLASAGAWVRWVKGAFAEPATVAARRAAAIDDRYRRGIEALLAPTARQAGCYASFATHDERLVDEVIAIAERVGCGRDGFEFEMLYGVRPQLQRNLARCGYQVRAYVPFGTDWFPYAIRRVGESPRNLRFTIRALARDRDS